MDPAPFATVAHNELAGQNDLALAVETFSVNEIQNQ
jgi:hypothetical protein